MPPRVLTSAGAGTARPSAKTRPGPARRRRPGVSADRSPSRTMCPVIAHGSGTRRSQIMSARRRWTSWNGAVNRTSPPPPTASTLLSPQRRLCPGGGHGRPLRPPDTAVRAPAGWSRYNRHWAARRRPQTSADSRARPIRVYLAGPTSVGCSLQGGRRAARPQSVRRVTAVPAGTLGPSPALRAVSPRSATSVTAASVTAPSPVCRRHRGLLQTPVCLLSRRLTPGAQPTPPAAASNERRP